MIVNKQIFIGITVATVIFAAGVIHSDFFTGLEKESNFLTASIAEREKDAEDLRVVFSSQEAYGLRQVVNQVRTILDTSGDGSDNAYEAVKLALIESNLQSDLIRMEKEWRKREGAWIVVKLLESIRIKSQLFLQNAYLLERLKKDQTDLRNSTLERMEKLIQGVGLSNNTLEEKVDEGTSSD